MEIFDMYVLKRRSFQKAYFFVYSKLPNFMLADPVHKKSTL